jgi:hypothetical protein
MTGARATSAVLLGLLLVVNTHAKDEPKVMVWPDPSKPVLRFSFGKFKEGPAYGHEHNYTCDTSAENLWDKRIPVATFTLYILDKNNVRVGEGFVQVSNLAPGETVKFQTTLHAAGVPVTLKLVPETLPAELQPPAPAKPPKAVSITVNSIPQGAAVKLDGEEMGTTPKIVRVTVGKHLLEFSKEGFTPGRFPMEIGADDASGGSVSFELGALAHDTVELRDGSVLVGDVESMSATEVIMRVGGVLQHVERNRVKRMLLTERDPPPGK